jgi:hypothetical protein
MDCVQQYIFHDAFELCSEEVAMLSASSKVIRNGDQAENLER